MKAIRGCAWLVLGVSLSGLAAKTIEAQALPQVLQPGIQVREVLQVGKNYIRIAKDPTSDEIFYLGANTCAYQYDRFIYFIHTGIINPIFLIINISII